MAFNFPSSPTLNQTYTSGSVTYTYNGQAWVIVGGTSGGSVMPDNISRSHVIADADGAQTNYALLTVATGSKIAITQISAVCDAANTINVAVRIGFGTANVPTPALAGTNGLLIDGVFGPGSGQQKGAGAGAIAIGADDEDLRMTCGDPQGGNLYIQYSYYLI